MRCTHRDYYARFANFQPAGSMDYADMRNVEALASFSSQPLEFALRHWFVSFINQKQSFAATSPFARVSV